MSIGVKGRKNLQLIKNNIYKNLSNKTGMKKICAILLLLSVVLAGCSKEEHTLNTQGQTILCQDTFIATFESSQTKTYVDDNLKQYWTNGDAISLFSSATNQEYTFNGTTGSSVATFEKVGSDEDNATALSASYAVYPYNASNSYREDGKLYITIPKTQMYFPNSFAPGANTMVAVTSSLEDRKLQFKQVCGFIRINMYGSAITVKSIELKGNNNEEIAGSAIVTASNHTVPTTAMAETAATAITLDCGINGVTLGATEQAATSFWFVVSPITFEKGFTITVTTSNGLMVTKSTTKKFIVERNKLKTMSAFNLSKIQPTNEIWYTSTDGNVVIPNNTKGFGAEYVSNTYANGKGVIRFNGPVTKFDYEGSNLGVFENCTNLRTIDMPSTTTWIAPYTFKGCNNLQNVIIGENVTKIGITAFSNCINLQSIVIPDNVVEIHSGAFNGCSSLQSVTIGKNVKSIGRFAFEKCDKLQKVYISDIKSWCKVSIY